jgi:glucose-1-phosphate thymidylyltransferase
VKGVVLAGGIGSRFAPVTKVVNKHLLDVFDEPMIFFPIRALARAEITDLVLVSGHDVDQFRQLLGDGSELGVRIDYAKQDGELGIAHALAQAEPLVRDEPMVVVLGDNIFQEDLTPQIQAFERQSSGARILLKEVAMDDAKRFAVASVEGDRIKEIVEKPAVPSSNLAVTGIYMLDGRAFDIIRTMTPSGRGELEITDVLSDYVDRGDITFDFLRGWWTDAGTPPSKLKASILVALEKGVTFHA